MLQGLVAARHRRRQAEQRLKVAQSAAGARPQPSS